MQHHENRIEAEGSRSGDETAAAKKRQRQGPEKTDRKEGVLRLLGAFAELDVAEEAVADDLAAELQQLATMVGVERVSVDANGRLANLVKAAL